LPPSLHWTSRTLHAELAKLVQAEILYPKGKPPQCTYSFKHALLEDALYNGLVKSRRQQFHARIAEAMAAGFPHIVETQPELLGHHFSEAASAKRQPATGSRRGCVHGSARRTAKRSSI